MSSNTVVIMNPQARGGDVGRRLGDLQLLVRKGLGDTRFRVTEAPGHASRLATKALREGADLVVACGGDGTVHEVVNGYFDADLRPVSANAALAVIDLGVEGDFARGLMGTQSLLRAARRIAAAQASAMDAIRVDCADGAGGQIRRVAVNVVSFGVSAEMQRGIRRGLPAASLDRARRRLSALRAWRNVPVEICCDDGDPERMALTLGAVANGRLFSGGMCIAPQADLFDGLLDLVELWDFGRGRFLAAAPRARSGTHLALTGVDSRRVTCVQARSLGSRPVWVEADGEILGQLPATFAVMPGALRLRH